MIILSLPYSLFRYYYIGDIAQNVFVANPVFESIAEF